MTPSDLGKQLTSLAAWIEPTNVDLVDRVGAAIESDSHPRRPSLVVAAGAVVLSLALLMATTPARSAVAGWLGIGNTRVDVVDETPVPAPTPAPVSGTAGESSPFDPVPDTVLTGPLLAREERDLDGVPEVILRYESVTISATAADAEILFVKSVDTSVVVSSEIITDGEPALWIGGAHVRTVAGATELVDGPALIWVQGGLEIRIVGEIPLDEAIAIAESID